MLQQLITAQSDKMALQSQINKHQHKLKDLNDDFKSRLNKYIKDIAVSFLLCLIFFLELVAKDVEVVL